MPLDLGWSRRWRSWYQVHGFTPGCPWTQQKLCNVCCKYPAWDGGVDSLFPLDKDVLWLVVSEVYHWNQELLGADSLWWKICNWFRFFVRYFHDFIDINMAHDHYYKEMKQNSGNKSEEKSNRTKGKEIKLYKKIANQKVDNIKRRNRLRTDMMTTMGTELLTTYVNKSKGYRCIVRAAWYTWVMGLK